MTFLKNNKILKKENSHVINQNKEKFNIQEIQVTKEEEIIEKITLIETLFWYVFLPTIVIIGGFTIYYYYSTNSSNGNINPPETLNLDDFVSYWGLTVDDAVSVFQMSESLLLETLIEIENSHPLLFELLQTTEELDPVLLSQVQQIALHLSI